MAVELRLDGKTAIITGGSAGIGLGIATEYVKAGANVMIVSRKADRCEAAADELRALSGGDVDWRAAHTGDGDGGADIMAATLERFGSIDILVNNAATNPYAGPLIDTPAAAFDKTYEVNLRGPLLWTQAAWNTWMKDNGGCVINLASVGAFKTSGALGLYAELGPNVRVNALAPAVVKTDFARLLWEGEAGERAKKAYPLGRLGEPGDIGRAALWLAADAQWMTGQTIVIDGGALVAFPG